MGHEKEWRQIIAKTTDAPFSRTGEYGDRSANEDFVPAQSSHPDTDFS